MAGPLTRPVPHRLPLRLYAGLTGGWGLVLLVRAELLRRSLCPEFPVSRRWVARLLGGRTVLQSVLVLTHPTRPWLLTAAGIDAAHAASMLFVLPGRSYRRSALLSGAVAATSAAAVAALARGVGR
jgi:hypothetical protein